ITNFCEELNEVRTVPSEPRPIGELVYVLSPHILRRLYCLFDALLKVVHYITTSVIVESNLSSIPSLLVPRSSLCLHRPFSTIKAQLCPSRMNRIFLREVQTKYCSGRPSRPSNVGTSGRTHRMISLYLPETRKISESHFSQP